MPGEGELSLVELKSRLSLLGKELEREKEEKRKAAELGLKLLRAKEGLQDRVEELERALELADASLESLHQEHRKLKSEKLDLEDLLAERSSQLEEKEREAAVAKSFHSLRARENELDSLQSAYQGRCQELKESVKKAEASQKSFEGLLSRQKRLQRDRRTLKGRNAELRSQVRKQNLAGVELLRLRREKRRLGKENRFLHSQLDLFATTRPSVSSPSPAEENAHLSNVVHDLREQLHGLQERLLEVELCSHQQNSASIAEEIRDVIVGGNLEIRKSTPLPTVSAAVETGDSLLEEPAGEPVSSREPREPEEVPPPPPPGFSLLSCLLAPFRNSWRRFSDFVKSFLKARSLAKKKQ